MNRGHVVEVSSAEKFLGRSIFAETRCLRGIMVDQVGMADRRSHFPKA
jgi:hypothetical protein